MRPSSAGSLPVDRLSSSPPSLHLLHLLLLLLLVPPSLSIQTERAESHDEFSCEPIGLRMCQDLPYNTTFMPNLLNHYDQQTAALAMEVGRARVTRVCVCGRVCVAVCVGLCKAPLWEQLTSCVCVSALKHNSGAMGSRYIHLYGCQIGAGRPEIHPPV